MAALLRHGARGIGGSVLQRTQAALTSPAVAEERRRLGSRFMHVKQGAGEEGVDSMLTRLHDRRLRIQRFNRHFTNILHSGFLVFSVYAILSCRDLLDKVEPANKTGKR